MQELIIPKNVIQFLYFFKKRRDSKVVIKYRNMRKLNGQFSVIRHLSHFWTKRTFCLKNQSKYVHYGIPEKEG